MREVSYNPDALGWPEVPEDLVVRLEQDYPARPSTPASNREEDIWYGSRVVLVQELRRVLDAQKDAANVLRR